MFHTYIVATSRCVIDFDRAAFLMDKDLLQQSLDAMRDERDNNPHAGVQYGAQWVWVDYCRRHLAHYGAGFVPDVEHGWDSSTEVADV